MARLIFLFVFLVAAAFAGQLSMQAQASDFQDEVLKIFNKTNQKLDVLTKLIHDKALEYAKRSEAENEKRLKEIQATLRCVRASSAKLTLLANGKMYSFQLAQKSWAAANETCVKQGLHLATITDQGDMKKILEEAEKVSRYTENYWVSAINSGEDQDKEYRWHDGTILDIKNSTMWKDDNDEKGDCVQIYKKYNSYVTYGHLIGKLQSYPCEKALYYICELPRECY